MPTITPWYSKLKGIKVYHNNTTCHLGNNIEPRNRKSGTGGKRICEECRRKNKQGK